MYQCAQYQRVLILLLNMAKKDTNVFLSTVYQTVFLALPHQNLTKIVCCMESGFSNSSATPSLSTEKVSNEMGCFSYEYVFQIMVLNSFSGREILQSKGSVVENCVLSSCRGE